MVFSTPYILSQNPNERRGFKLVTEYLRDNEEEANRDPVGSINRAFEFFTIKGERAASTCHLRFLFSIV